MNVQTEVIRKVFVVHGHQHGTRDTVARFLEKLELEPVILDEEANRGRTVIEKFLDHSDVAFAIVLVIGDDVGGIKGSDPTALRSRARQNVIFELGYFVGKLGRDRVCALYEPGVEMPSDFGGVGYVKFDPDGNWRVLLAKELNAARIKVDMNKALFDRAQRQGHGFVPVMPIAGCGAGIVARLKFWFLRNGFHGCSCEHTTYGLFCSFNHYISI